MKRRDVLTRASWSLTGAALTACGGADAAPDQKKNFLLVHGAWHSGAHWNRVSTRLTAMGHKVVAMDLPGAGLNGLFPRSFLSGDQAALATEPSPQAGITLNDYRDAVVAQVRAMAVNGPVTLVSHSMGGMTATVAAEAVPELIGRLVYLTSLVPVRLKNILEYQGLPEFSTAKLGPLFWGDPTQIGAARINPRNTDPVYQENARIAFYNDIDKADFERFAAMLICDVPAQVAAGDARGTAARWGKLPRTFIRCLKDNSLPLAVQDLMIADADALTPTNKFDVKTLDSSHSSFASLPAQLAALLDGLA